VYSFKAATDGQLIVRPVGHWNDYEITADPPDFTASLNGQEVNRYRSCRRLLINPVSQNECGRTLRNTEEGVAK
jgi:hypothetical protein